MVDRVVFDEISALHAAWVDRGVKVADALAALATVLASTAVNAGATPMALEMLETLMASAYAKCMKLRLEAELKKINQ